MNRFTKQTPCPICGGADGDKRGTETRCYGFLSDDGDYAHCTREDRAGSLQQNAKSNAFPHRLQGPCKCGVTHNPDYSKPPAPTTTADGGNHAEKKAKTKKARAPKAKKKLVAVYDYQDENGNLLVQVCRYEPKTFLQRRPDGNGHWIWALSDSAYRKNAQGDWVTVKKRDNWKGPTQSFRAARLVLYGLPQILANPGKCVFVVEGEKDADSVRKLGFLATCNLAGAKKWRDEYSETLRGRAVYISPHNDGDGRAHAFLVAASLHGLAKVIKIINLPDLPDKGDVSDWLKAGHTKEDLTNAVHAAPEWTPEIPQPDDDMRLTDIGNARALVEIHRHEIKYVYPFKSWLAWDGKRWAPDSTGNVMRRSKVIVQSLYDDAIKAKADLVPKRDKEEFARADALERHALKSAAEPRIRAMLNLAQSEPGGQLQPADLDADPWKLNAINGTIDLRTGKLTPHHRHDFISKLVPVVYDPGADYTPWIEFLDRVLPDPLVQDYIQRVAGYSCTGLASEELIIFIYGPTSSGKSTFLEAIGAALGDYADTADFESFLQRRATPGARTDIARLAGKRFVRSIEVEHGRKLAEGLLKSLAGGDTIVARHLYQEEFEYRPQFTLWLCANDKPAARNDDEALWRRIKPIPFNESIPKAQRDPLVKLHLTDPALAGPRILSWLVEGAMLWHKHGMAETPTAIHDALAQYRAENDPIADWLADDCTIDDPDAFTDNHDLRRSYIRHAEAAGTKRYLGPRAFSNQLKAHGFAAASRKIELRTVRGWIGIAL